MLTQVQFNQALIGDGADIDPESKRRIRHIAADLLSEKATYWSRQGRPDKAARVRWVASRIENGLFVSKGLLQKIANDTEAICRVLPDPTGCQGLLRRALRG